MHWTSVAVAMALGFLNCAWAAAAADERVVVDFSAAASDDDLGGGAGAPVGESWFVITETTAPEGQLSSAASNVEDAMLPALRAEGASPVAPLPPAIFLGTLGIGMVALANYQLRKRGRI